jgi:hypothetical protein
VEISVKFDPLSLPVIVTKPLWRHMLPLTGSAALVGIGGYALSEEKPWWIGWPVIVIFGGIVLFHLGRLMNSRPRLTISKDGICSEVWDSDMLPWDDFSGAFLNTADGIDNLCLTLREPEEYRRNANRFRRMIHTAARETGYGDLTVKLSGMGLDAAEVVALVRQQIDRAKTNPKQPDSSFRYPSVK